MKIHGLTSEAAFVGLGVWDLGFRVLGVWDLGFLGFRVLWFGVYCFELGVQGWRGFLRVWDFRAYVGI